MQQPLTIGELQDAIAKLETGIARTAREKTGKSGMIPSINFGLSAQADVIHTDRFLYALFLPVTPKSPA